MAWYVGLAVVFCFGSLGCGEVYAGWASVPGFCVAAGSNSQVGRAVEAGGSVVPGDRVMVGRV